MRRTIVMCVVLMLCAAPVAAQGLSSLEQLGKSIFFDERLSFNGNQSCASCHAPEVGWTGPISTINAGGAVVEGSIAGRFGNRKPPSSAYATFSPILHYLVTKKDALFVGGNFWDGRATGEKLGNPAADQAQGPFLNPLEHALGSPGEVVALVCGGPYANRFRAVWGSDACDDVSSAYDRIALSIAAYENSHKSNSFTSKYDYFVRGMTKLTQQEKKGLNLFNAKGKCGACHTIDKHAEGSLLTDFTFDNLGVPRNPDNPFYSQTAYNPLGYDWVDEGLGAFLATHPTWSHLAAENLGKQKVPTLRNVDKRPYPGFVKAYGHNGYFKSLKGIVHFYNTRDIKPRCADPFTREADALAQNCWPAPEVEANVNADELGDLKLTPDQEDAIVAFLEALSDGWQP
jgi:cytochrome c peroxidase